MTNMVFEFTDTRGVMGMHYARHDGEAEDVAVALNEQYQPRFAGDDLPSNPVACALAIADKMDTPAGIFGIGQHPKATKTRLRCVVPHLACCVLSLRRTSTLICKR